MAGVAEPRRRLRRKTGSVADGTSGDAEMSQVVVAEASCPQEKGDLAVSKVAGLGLYGRGRKGRGKGSGKKGEQHSLENSLEPNVNKRPPLDNPLPFSKAGLPGRLRPPRWSSSRMAPQKVAGAQ